MVLGVWMYVVMGVRRMRISLCVVMGVVMGVARGVERRAGVRGVSRIASVCRAYSDANKGGLHVYVACREADGLLEEGGARLHPFPPAEDEPG